MKQSSNAVLIETQNASIDTLVVTIRSLHVNNKQMTLAVFRQLPTFPVYRNDGTLEPMEHWGLVRYEIKDDGRLWLVASRNGVLYRGNVLGFRYDFFADEINRVDALIEKARLQFAECLQWEGTVEQYKAAQKAHDDAREELENACPIAKDQYEKRHEWIRKRLPEYPLHVSDIRYPPNAIFNKWVIGTSDEYKEYINDCLAILEIMKEANRSYRELIKLPQLFIAV